MVKIHKKLATKQLLKFLSRYKQKALTILMYLIYKKDSRGECFKKNTTTFKKMLMSFRLKMTNYIMLTNLLYMRHKTKVLIKYFRIKNNKKKALVFMS